MNQNNRNVSGNFQGAQIGNFNQGDQVEQVQNLAPENKFYDQLINAITQAINQLPAGDDKNDALDNSRKIDKALREGKLDRAKTIFGWLPQAVQMASEVATVLQASGLHL